MMPNRAIAAISRLVAIGRRIKFSEMFTAIVEGPKCFLKSYSFIQRTKPHCSFRRMQEQFLRPPIQELGDIDLILRRACHLVNPAELLGLAAAAAQNPEHFAVEREFVDAPRKCVGAVEILRGSGCNADGPGCAVLRRRTLRAGLVAHPRVSVGRDGHVDSDLAQKIAFAVEDLDAPVAAIRHVDVPVSVGGNAVRRVELSGFGPAIAPLLYPVSVLVVLSYARVYVAVAEEDVALRVPGDIGGLPELRSEERRVGKE